MACHAGVAVTRLFAARLDGRRDLRRFDHVEQIGYTASRIRLTHRR